MYVSYSEYAANPMTGEVGEAKYASLASLADGIIDAWTLGRVGYAVESGAVLPDSVKNLYSAIVSNLPELIKQAEAVEGTKLQSFSNGVDSYSFATVGTYAERLYDALSWLIDALPIEYTSWCVKGSHV